MSEERTFGIVDEESGEMLERERYSLIPESTNASMLPHKLTLVTDAFKAWLKENRCYSYGLRFAGLFALASFIINVLLWASYGLLYSGSNPSCNDPCQAAQPINLADAKNSCWISVFTFAVAAAMLAPPAIISVRRAFSSEQESPSNETQHHLASPRQSF